MSNRAAPAPTEGKVVPTQHTFNTLPTTNLSPTTTLQFAPAPPFNPFSVNTFQDAPAPQHTSNTFSANTFQHTPAPQWPLPNMPASYPIMPTDPVAVQSGQYNSWSLLHHLNTLVASLIREVSSPVYQISAESRSRFTGVIRATHTTEIVEAERGEQRRYANYGNVEPSATLPPTIARLAASRQHGRPLSQMNYQVAGRRQSSIGNLSMPIPASGPPPSPPPPMSDSSRPKKEQLAVMERTQVQSRRCNEYDYNSYDLYDEEQPATKKAETAPREDSYSASQFSQDEGTPMLESCDFEVCLEEQSKVPEPKRNNVVDDLVKLWTLVR